MPTIIVKGRRVQVSDDFFNLPHEDQEATIRQIGDRIAYEAITGTRQTNFDQPPVPNDEPKPEPSWSDVPQNIRPSAVNAATGLWDMITHPQRTAETLVDAAQGGVDRIVPEEFTNFMDTYVSPRSRETRERQHQVSGAVGEALYDRYGTWRNIRNTMITDPVGSALDIVGIATGAAGLVRGGLAVGSKANLVKTPGTALNAERLATSEFGSIVPENNTGRATAAGLNKRAHQLSHDKPVSDIQPQQARLPQTPKSDLPTPSIIRPDRRLLIPNPSIIMPDTRLVMPSRPAVQGMSGPRDWIDDAKFEKSAGPGGRTTPWVVPPGPLAKAPRDSSLDYPNGVDLDEYGRVRFDIDGRKLIAQVIAGRQRLGQKDVPITGAQIRQILKELGVPINKVPRDRIARNRIGRRGLGQYDPVHWNSRGRIDIWEGLPDDQADVVLAHEFGHLVDRLVGYPRVRGLGDELDIIYSENMTGQLNPPRRIHPRDNGYERDEYRREKMAEAVRTQLFQPNTIKTIGPKTASLLRERINEHPILSKYLQVNGIPVGILAGAGAAAMSVNPSESHAGQTHPSNDAVTPDTKFNLRKIAAALPAPVRRKVIPGTIELIARALSGEQAHPLHGGSR